MINFLHFIDEDLEGFGKYAKLRSHGARVWIYVYYSSKVCCTEQTGSWRTLRPKKKKKRTSSTNCWKMMESWRMSKKAKLCKSFLFLTSIRRMIFALERVKQEKRLGLYCWINRKVRECLIPQDHTIGIRATKTFANVISNISTDNLEKS